MPSETQIPHLYVLAGGQSSRFGSDKALAEVDGQPMIQNVIDRLHRDGQAVTLVTGEAKRYETFGHAVITDRPAHVGPIGGLAAALDHQKQSHDSDWIMLGSCDLVDPDPAWAQQLCTHRETICNRAIAFRGERWEPLFALYHTDLLPLIHEQIAHGRRSMQGLLDLAGAFAVDLPTGLPSIPQANTPEQLITLRKRSVA